MKATEIADKLIETIESAARLKEQLGSMLPCDSVWRHSGWLIKRSLYGVDLKIGCDTDTDSLPDLSTLDEDKDDEGN